MARRVGPFDVRAAAPADAGEISRLIRANNDLHDLGDAAFTPERAAQDLFGSNPILRGAVAERAGGALAGVILWCDGYESAFGARGAYICDIFAEPEARRHGVGRALMAEAAAAVKQAGGVYLWWASQTWNVEAQRFYAAIGASEETVKAHAVTDAAFDALAAAAAGDQDADA